MHKKIFSLLLVLALVAGFSLNCEDDDDFNGTLQVTITGTSSALGSYLFGVFSHPDIGPESRDIINGTAEAQYTNLGDTSIVFTMHNLTSETVYLSVLYDIVKPYGQADTGDMYYTWQDVTYNVGTPTPITLNDGGTTTVEFAFSSFKTYTK